MTGPALGDRRERRRGHALRHPVRRAAVLAVAVLVLGFGVGCGHYIDGAARTSTDIPDQAFFFAGAVPTYGRDVGPGDRATLAYLRALRRIDVCGLLDRQALARIGDITSVATLYAFNECDVAVKVPGDAALRFISAELILARTVGAPVMRAGGLEVHETSRGSCEYLVPLPLSGLPGAPAQSPAFPPYVHVALIGPGDCALAERAARSTAEHLARTPLPPRDGAAVYSVPLAERDPCEVLTVLDGAPAWDIGGTGVYECAIGGGALQLRPSLVDIVTENTEVQRADDPGAADVYLDPELCTATAFVGPPMQRRLANGDFAEVPNVVVRPSVVAEGGDCEHLGPIAAKAAGLYR